MGAPFMICLYFILFDIFKNLCRVLYPELKIDLPDGEYVTLAGFLLDILGKIPEEGDILGYEGWTFKITRMDKRRIAKIVLESPDTASNKL